MKKGIVFIFFMACLGVGCGSDASSTSDAESEALKQEIMTIDSTTAVIDSMQNEIETSAEKLNELLNELN